VLKFKKKNPAPKG